MGRVYLELENNEWKEKQVQTNFWIHDYLLNKLNGLLYIQKKNWDGVIIIDGKERSGKSVLGMIIGWYLSKGQLTINNFARGLQDAARKIASLPDKSVLIMDEGSLVFSSKDSNTQMQRKLIKLMDVVGQKNMIFIICLPCFFDLNKTIAVRRSLFLCHVYPNERYDRGQYAFWGEKDKKTLYITGKKHFDSYAIPNAEFVGEYMDFEPPFYKEYLEIVKKQSLQEVMSEAQGEKKSAEEVIRKREEEIVSYLIKNKKMTQAEVAEVLNIGKTTVQNRIRANKREIMIAPISK